LGESTSRRAQQGKRTKRIGTNLVAPTNSLSRAVHTWWPCHGSVTPPEHAAK